MTFALKVVPKVCHRIKTDRKNIHQLINNGTALIQLKNFFIIFGVRCQNPELIEVFEFSSDTIDLLINISAEFSDKKTFFWIKIMLEYKFLKYFFPTFRPKELL